MSDEVITEPFGAIAVTTGFDLFDPTVYGEYGYGRFPDVITGLELERLMNASGPTHGHVLRPSDGKAPKTVVLISCVGSRDKHVDRPYCSDICCMYQAKHAIMMKEHDPEVEVYNFYMDIRAGGKDYDEFTRRAIEQYDTHYIRGRVSQVYERNGRLVVEGMDTIMGRPVEMEADLVVLATGVTAPEGARELFQTLSISYNQYDFINEAHPKLQPVETNSDGIFLAGCVTGPKDIPATVAQASGAAAKVLGILNKDTLVANPMVAVVDEAECVACQLCVQVCPYGAPEMTTTRRGKPVAQVNPSLCKGCGLCVNACRGGAVNLKGFTDQQLVHQVAALFDEPLVFEEEVLEEERG
jgi:heterodisulfide reductase subunit A